MTFILVSRNFVIFWAILLSFLFNILKLFTFMAYPNYILVGNRGINLSRIPLLATNIFKVACYIRIFKIPRSSHSCN